MRPDGSSRHQSQLFRQEALRFGADRGAEMLLPRAVRHRGDDGFSERCQSPDCPLDAKLARRTGAAPRCILTNRLAEGISRIRHIADIIGDLVGSSDLVAEAEPQCGISACSERSGTGSGREQRSCLGTVICLQRNLRLALPGLTRADTMRRASGLPDQPDHPGNAMRCLGHAARNRLERIDDQRVADKHCDGFTESHMDGGKPAPQIRVIETGQIVMHQRRAMQQFDGSGGSIGRSRIAISAGHGDRDAELGTDAMPAGKHRRMQCVGKLGWTRTRFRGHQGPRQRALDTTNDIHVHPHREKPALMKVTQIMSSRLDILKDRVNSQ
jgi:hypothetical protein